MARSRRGPTPVNAGWIGPFTTDATDENGLLLETTTGGARVKRHVNVFVGSEIGCSPRARQYVIKPNHQQLFGVGHTARAIVPARSRPSWSVASVVYGPTLQTRTRVTP